MSDAGRTPFLLLKRAGEYRVLGQLNKAAADLREALKSEPNLAAAHTELSRIYLAQSEPAKALAAITQALALVSDEKARAPLRMWRAEIFVAQNKPAEALADIARAFETHPADIDWYLQRAQIQSRLGKFAECVAGLKAGFDQTGSAVLEIEWIEALIDAGQFRQALERIEPQLASARWQSSWLLRRARARKGLGEEFAADVRAAITELNRRLSPQHPDLTLLADRGTANALLGKMAEARKDLVAAKNLGADAWVVRRLETLLQAPLTAKQ